MSEALLIALTYLLVEALASGMELSQILSRVKETGDVPDEDWNKLVASLEENEKPWL